MSICKHCGKYYEASSMLIIDGNLYCPNCVLRCDDCGEYYLREDVHTDDRGTVICDSCWDNGNYHRCYNCNEIIHGDYVYWGADMEPYCEDCWCEYFTTCDRCGEILYRDNAIWDSDREEYVCEDCYNRNNVIYNYHDFDVDEFVPRYLDDVDRNEHYKELYGIELEITGSYGTADIFQSLMGEDVILMYDSSVNGYEMVSMPMSRKYIYEKFIPTLDKGLKYLRDNNMKGHGGGGIHIHFKKLEPLGVANFVNMLGTDNDKEIFRLISQRSESSMRSWCNIYQEFRYTPEYMYEHDYLTLGYGIDNHSMPLNYDTRTSTHELRIFNSNLRLERVIKNYEFMFALEDYLNKQHDIKATTLGLLQFIADNCEKYPTLNNFLWEKEIYNKAMEFYGELFVSPYNMTSTTEV